MNLLICEFCGKVFKSKSKLKKYCSKKCKCTAIRIQREENGQLCWTCKNACGGCSWSSKLIPIKGWSAIPDVIKDDSGDIHTFKILKCPQYIKGR